MDGRLQEIQDKVPDEMTQEEANNIRNAEFPELRPQTSFRLQVHSVPKLFFTVAQNMFYETMLKTWKLDISVIVFNRSGEKMYTVNKSHPRPGSKLRKYFPNIRERKFRLSDDIGPKMNLSKLEAEAHYVVITIDIKDLNGLIAAAADFTYARIRMSDFHTDQTFNQANLSQEFRFDTLKDPSLEEEVKQSSSLIYYHLYRSAEFGWMIESIRFARNISGESGLSTLEAQFSKLIITSNKDDSPSRLATRREQEKVKTEPVDTKKHVQEKEKRKAKDDPKHKDSKEPAPKGELKGDRVEVEKKKEEEIPQPKLETKLVTRTFGPVDLIYSNPVEVVKERVIEAIKKEQPGLFNTFEFGYQLHIENKPHVRPTQIKRIQDMASFEIKGRSDVDQKNQSWMILIIQKVVMLILTTSTMIK